MGRFKDELGWFLGDLAALALLALFVPLLPVFFLFDDFRKYHEEERRDAQG